MSTKVLLATSEVRVRDHFGHLLAEAEEFELAGAVRDGAGVLAALERDPEIGVVVIDQAAEAGNGHALARQIGVGAPLVGIVMLVPATGPTELAAAMDVGARSVVSMSSSLDEVLSRLEAVARWSASARAAIEADFVGGRAGRVVAVAGAKGGVGATTTTLLLGRAHAGRRTVTVVDFDLGAGDLAAYAGVHTRRSVVDLAEVAGEITSRMLRETSYEVNGGLRLLSAPNQGERGEEMNAQAARSIVSALRYESDLAILDVGSHLDEARATVLEFADAALLLTTPDLPSLRATRRTLEQWERLAIRQPDTVEVVLNRRSKSDQVTPQLAERVIERPVAFSMPEGGTSFEGAMNTATLLEVTTPVHQAVAQAGDSILARQATVAEEKQTQDGELEVEQLMQEATPTTRRSRRQEDKKRRWRRAEAGQTMVELPIAIGIGLVVVLLCLQAIAWTAGLMVARSAAQDGARTVGIAQGYDATVAAEARHEVEDRLIGPWREDAAITVGPEEVRVRVTTPTIFPGASFSAESTASVYRER